MTVAHLNLRKRDTEIFDNKPLNDRKVQKMRVIMETINKKSGGKCFGPVHGINELPQFLHMFGSSTGKRYPSFTHYHCEDTQVEVYTVILPQSTNDRQRLNPEDISKVYRTIELWDNREWTGENHNVEVKSKDDAGGTKVVLTWDKLQGTYFSLEMDNGTTQRIEPGDVSC